jgi:catalase
MEPSPALSIQKNMKTTLEGRSVGILFADGSDGDQIDTLIAALKKVKSAAVLIAPKVGGATLADGSIRKAQGQLAGTPSQLFDAVALILAPEAAASLAKNSTAVEFISNAFVHLKAIGATKAAQTLLDRSGVIQDGGITGLGNDFLKAATGRHWEREAKVRLLA